MRIKHQFILLFILLASVAVFGQETGKAVPAGAKVFVNPINDEFDSALLAAFKAKKVPIEIVTEKSAADFEITGTSETKKAGAAKILLTGSWRSNEQASITLTNLKSGEAVWAYSVNKMNSAHGKRSSAEACAKHLKEKIESKK